MRVAVVTGPGSVELREEAEPALGPEELLIEIGACGLCTMERRLFSGDKPVYPVAPGHEAAGHVVELGDAVRDLPGSPRAGELVVLDLLTRCGTCGACRRGRSALCQRPQGGTLSDGTISMGAGLADYVRVRSEQAWPLGEVPMRQAAMGEPLACVAHSLRRGGFRSGDRVAVLGGGYMGRLHLAVAKAGGAASAGVVDVSAERLEDASGAGATWAAPPAEALAIAGPQDVVFVTAGAPGVLELALELCDEGGTVVVYGAFPKGTKASVDPDAIHHHERSVIGVYSHEAEDWRTAAGWLSSGVVSKDLDLLVTAEFPLLEVAKAFDLVSSGPVYRVLVGGPDTK